jgi:hypothetical protein
MGQINQRAPIMFAPNLYTDASQSMQNMAVIPPADFEPAELIDPNLLSEVCYSGFSGDNRLIRRMHATEIIKHIVQQVLW